MSLLWPHHRGKCPKKSRHTCFTRSQSHERLWRPLLKLKFVNGWLTSKCCSSSCKKKSIPEQKGEYRLNLEENKGRTLFALTGKLQSVFYEYPANQTTVESYALYSISQEICTRFCCALLCCGYAIVHNEFTWSIYPYSSGLLWWHWGNR